MQTPVKSASKCIVKVKSMLYNLFVVMKKIISLLLLVAAVVAVFSFVSKKVSAQDSELAPAQFSIGQVTQIVEEGEKEVAEDYKEPFQKVKVKLLLGSERGKEIEIDHGSLFSLQESQKVRQGELVVVTEAQADLFYISDKFRLVPAVVVLAALLALILVIGKTEALGLLASMAVSVAILTNFTVPQIIAGKNPLLIASVSVVGISALMVYLGYGLGRRMTVALLGSIAALGLSLALVYGLLQFAFISGSGSEEAIFLQTGMLDANGLKGLLLAGILTGVLGVVNYLSVEQVKLVEEIKKEFPKDKKMVLVGKAVQAARGRAVSMVSIVFFAFVGTSITLLMLFGINQQVPFWVTLNSEFLMEEVIRLLTGMTAVLLVLPTTSFIAVNWASGKTPALKGKRKA